MGLLNGVRQGRGWICLEFVAVESGKGVEEFAKLEGQAELAQYGVFAEMCKGAQLGRQVPGETAIELLALPLTIMLGIKRHAPAMDCIERATCHRNIKSARRDEQAIMPSRVECCGQLVVPGPALGLEPEAPPWIFNIK